MARDIRGDGDPRREVEIIRTGVTAARTGAGGHGNAAPAPSDDGGDRRLGSSGHEAREPATETGLSVYYDGGCPLCRAEIDHYRRCEGADRLVFVDVGRAAVAPALGADLDRETAQRRFHVRDPEGRLVSGAAAFARLWKALPGWRWLGRLVDLRVCGVRPLLPVAEAAYRLSLPLRPHVARLVAGRRR